MDCENFLSSNCSLVYNFLKTTLQHFLSSPSLRSNKTSSFSSSPSKILLNSTQQFLNSNIPSSLFFENEEMIYEEFKQRFYDFSKQLLLVNEKEEKEEKEEVLLERSEGEERKL